MASADANAALSVLGPSLVRRQQADMLPPGNLASTVAEAASVTENTAGMLHSSQEVWAFLQQAARR